jgi:GT2 family glycosyltransferase
LSTRILDIDLTRAAEGFDSLGACDHALVVVRRGRVPLGQLTLPVRDGRIPPGAIRDALTPDLLTRWAIHAEAERHGLCDAPSPREVTATVAICTRERPDDLRRSLAAAAALPNRGGGVLVIDNCPATQATRELAARFPEVRYVMEPRKGLNNARNRALGEAGTDIVAFIDDDAVADPGWLDAIVATFARPEVGCVTGLTLPLELDNAAQVEFEALAGFSKRGFDRREFRSPPLNPLATGPIGAGANMAVRRLLLDAVGPFDPALDAGTPTMSGGDHEYMSRILRAGWTIVYEPRALNWHRHRRTRDEMVKAVYGYGVGTYAAWTRSLLVERDWGVIGRACGWLVHEQLPNVARSLARRPGALPLDVVLAELRGCAKGPFAYLAARRQDRRFEQPEGASA